MKLIKAVNSIDYEKINVFTAGDLNICISWYLPNFSDYIYIYTTYVDVNDVFQ